MYYVYMSMYVLRNNELSTNETLYVYVCMAHRMYNVRNTIRFPRNLPYHSRTLIAYILISLSKSSNNPMACTIMMSTLSAENFNLYL